MTAQGKLKEILASGQFVAAPGVFDMFSARIADRFDFKALYMTGYGVSASYNGYPDAGISTYTDFVRCAGQIASGTSKPLIADADTGFGGLINVRYTVRGYEAAGVQAIQIEDQETPKKCGHTKGRRVLPIDDMVRKVEVAVEARRSDDTLIIARTDARTSLGLKEAIERGKAYARAGADIVFVEAPESADEFRRIADEIDAYLLANIVPTGFSPEVSGVQLKQWGFDIAIYPTLGMGTATAAMKAAYGFLERNGSTIKLDVPFMTMAELHELVGFEEVWEFEQRHGLAPK